MSETTTTGEIKPLPVVPSKRVRKLSTRNATSITGGRTMTEILTAPTETDYRAVIAVVVTAGILVLIGFSMETGKTIPLEDALAVAWGAVVGWYFAKKE